MAVYTMSTTYNSFTDMIENEHMNHESEHAQRNKTSGGLVSRANKEDARVLLQISYLLDKKKQQKNKKNSDYHPSLDIEKDCEPQDCDSELIRYQSSSCNTITHSTSYSHASDSINSDTHYGLQSPDDGMYVDDNILLPHQGPPRNKTEERALKRIRRKIKNKLSAQESRRKKKEYLENLEKTVVSCTSENGILKEQVSSLNNTVRQLLRELKRVQESKSTKDISTQTGICLKCHLLKTSKANTSQDQS